MIFLVNPSPGRGNTMARRTPPRYKSGPKKGQFMPKSARGRKSSKRRRSNPPAATAAPRRRRRRRTASSSSSSSPRRRGRRRNPPSMRGIVGQLVQGGKDASGVLLGKASARAVPQLFNLPQSGVIGLAVQLGVALATGLAAHKFVGRDYGRFVMAGGISAPLETFIVSKNIPYLAPALSPQTAAIAVGAYSNYRGNYAIPMASYARNPGLQSYAKAAAVSDGADYAY